MSKDESLNSNKLVHQLFEEQVNINPFNIALICQDEKLSYKELNKRSNQLANFLKGKKILKGTTVGVVAERSIDTIISILGILKIGASYLPIDISNPKDRVLFMINDAKIEFLLYSKHLPEEFKFHEVTNIDVHREFFLNGENLENINKLSDLMYVIYTSGSTGKPKGVMINHNNLLTLLNGFNNVSKIPDPLIGTTICPFSFDVSVWEIFSVLCFGGTLCILTEEVLKMPRYIVDYICKYNITNAYIPPSLLNYIISDFEKRNIKMPIKRLLVGVEPIKAEVLLRYIDLSCEIEIINGYGPTETTICATLYKFNKNINKNAIIPIGKAIDGYNVYLVDSNMKLVKKEQVGEILIGGQGVSPGYINNDKLTKEKFINNIFDDDNKIIYKTGDLGKLLDDGNIQFKGRVDDQIKIRGNRVELSEIRTSILSIEGIKEAAVIVRGDNDLNKNIVAYYTCEKDISTYKIKDHLNNWLPEYMIPSDFIRLNEMPKNKNGKVNKEILY